MNTVNYKTSVNSSLSNYVNLDKGDYLAPQCMSYEHGSILVGLTHYPEPIKTGKWHSHKRPLISTVLTGGNIERRENSSYERLPGSTHFYHAQELHSNEYCRFPAKHLSLEVDTKFLQENGFNELDMKKAVLRSEYTQLTLVTILKEAIQGDDLALDNIQMLVLRFLSESKQESNPPICSLWVQSVKELIHHSWNQPISLEDLSNVSGVHPCTISKNFKRHFHYGFSTYLRRLRIQHSLTMLKNNNYSTAEIALNCGFSDHSHFTRNFKSITGFLPKIYRTL